MAIDFSHFQKPFTLSPSVRETASEDGAVLLDVEKGVCFSLNSVGLRIWTLLKEDNNIDQIISQLESAYKVPRPQLMEDICTFMQQLEDRQLLLIQHEDTGSVKKHGFFNRFWGHKST